MVFESNKIISFLGCFFVVIKFIRVIIYLLSIYLVLGIVFVVLSILFYLIYVEV